MLKRLQQNKAQSTLEYAILIVIIIGALISIQVYIKRSIQGAAKSNTDQIGGQYSNGNTRALKTVKTNSTTVETFDAGTSVSRLVGPEQTSTTGYSNIINSQVEYMGNPKVTN